MSTWLSRSLTHLPARLLLAACLALAGFAQALAQPGVYESEPNNTPLDANPVAGEVTLYGTMAATDQDGFLWTVSDEDARKRWDFELHGIPGALTVVQIFRVRLTDDGQGVAAAEKLLKLGSRDGTQPVAMRGLLFDPGEYLIGLAYAGGPRAPGPAGGGMLGLKPVDLAFGEEGAPQAAGDALAQEVQAEEPGAYRLHIREGSRLTVSANPGAREAREDARPIRLGRAYATFEPLGTAWYSFDFDADDAEQRWAIEISAPVGRHLVASLHDANGEELLSRAVDDQGQARLADLAPGATTWYLKLVSREPGFIHRVGIEPSGRRVGGEEAEPNNAKALANRVDFSQPVTGRIGDGDSEDRFRFTVDQALSEQRLSLRIDTSPPVSLRFCLTDSHMDAVQCRDATSPVELPDLVLAPGDWGVHISRAGESDYELALLPQGPIVEGIEVEPNDSTEHAVGVPSNLRIKGRFAGAETDYYRLLIADEPQLWRFQVTGDGIRQFAYYDGSGRQKAQIKATGDQRRVRLDNLFLLPGTHYLRVTGSESGDYTVLARAIGPPDPDGELEPNDDHNMQRLAFGQTRNGLLAEPDDSDYYRFFLGNWDHLRLTLQPPRDGTLDYYLYWDGAALADGNPGEPGEAVTLQGLFPPGDYHIWLKPGQVSEDAYRVTLERLPRFACPADCEPNGMREIYLAAPLPPDLVLEGSTGQWRDWDYYQLPAFDTDTPIILRTPEAVRTVALGTHYRARETLSFDADLGGYAATVPAGPAQRVMLDSRGAPYRLQLEFPDGPLAAVTGPLSAELQLGFREQRVAAYHRQGQVLHGQLEIRNTGSAPFTAMLEAATSDHRWSATLAQTEVQLGGGAAKVVPVRVSVPADAWADRPVRISLRAREASGRQAETWEEIDVDRTAQPVNPERYWPIPAALRGGFNAAWLPFGAQWTPDNPREVRSDILRDGLVFPGARMSCCGDGDGWSDEERPLWTLDLPGDEPVPVAGIALNHFGATGPYHNIREATLLLSPDGTQFDEVLSILTLPLKHEQHFALDRPVNARFARLRIESTFEEASSQRVTASEWKVILAPGFDLSHGVGFNLADPALGGHLAWDWPPEPYSPTGVLQEPEKASRAGTRRGREKIYVVGFNQNRAAQITRVEWLYPEQLGLQYRNFARVELAASMESPIGPWVPLGAFELDDAQTRGGLVLEQPAWARFVRFRAEIEEGASLSNEPGELRVWERPTSAEYRSVLSEWGELDSRAWFEAQAGPESGAVPAVGQNLSRATAAPVTPGTPVSGAVSLGKYAHWYRLDVPADANTLLVDLAGDPTVRTVLTMEDIGAEPMILRTAAQGRTPGRHRYEAVVEPGSTVWLKLAEPPRNVIFSWDTSPSVNAYIDLINRSLVAFSGQVVPGQEAVNLMPFPMSPLLGEWHGEPYVLQTILNDYRREASSSSAEYTLKNAARALGPLPGTKAIVVITDAQTPHDGAMWEAMRAVQPRIFGIGVAGSKRADQDRFRDWAAINGGHYTQLRYDGEMEVAFDRATALMHRPAGYTLVVHTEFREAPGPGRLSVVAGEAAATGGAAVELILDASGSMLQRLDGKRRIAVAKEVLTEAVTRHIPAGTPVALRVFGHREVDSCRTDLEIPLGPLDPAQAAATIAGINAMNLARTPIADSLAAVENDLAGAASGLIVLVTDGEETCEGDPGEVIEALQTRGFEVDLNIVGFAIDDAELAAQFESWAEQGGGRYFAASDQGGLSESIQQALRLPYTVFDAGGNEVATGLVDGAPVELEEGVYRVLVRTAPPQTFDEVEVAGESEVRLELR